MNNDSQRVATLHPDEHVHIIIDRIGNVRESLMVYSENADEIEALGEQIDELESLRSYLRTQRLGEHS